jgi:predicted lysophospholipase L1 biosynthesis ABC-type transport system permease subunit
MTVILVFLALVVLGDAAAIGISSIVERFSQTASLFVFLALFVAVFGIAWQIAVYITERYILRQN